MRLSTKLLAVPAVVATAGLAVALFGAHKAPSKDCLQQITDALGKVDHAECHVAQVRMMPDTGTSEHWMCEGGHFGEKAEACLAALGGKRVEFARQGDKWTWTVR